MLPAARCLLLAVLQSQIQFMNRQTPRILHRFPEGFSNSRVGMYSLSHFTEGHTLVHGHSTFSNQSAGIRAYNVDAHYPFILLPGDYFDKTVYFADGV